MGRYLYSLQRFHLILSFLEVPILLLLPPKTALLVGMFGNSKNKKILGDIYTKPICENSECPKANTQLTLTLIPRLPNPYAIVFGILIHLESHILCSCYSW